MRSVADQEDPACAEPRCEHALHRPARDLVDFHREVGDAKREAHVLLDALVGEIFRTFALIGDMEDPSHSSLSGPQWSGPIGTSTAISPMAGHQIQRISTSGSRASFDRLAETCAVATWASAPRPS